MTRQRRRNIIRARRTGTGIALVAAISFIAGMTDAVGLHLSGDFVSFMTGNTTRAAISLEAGVYSHAAKLLFAIVAFVAGNAGASWLRINSTGASLPFLWAWGCWWRLPPCCAATLSL